MEKNYNQKEVMNMLHSTKWNELNFSEGIIRQHKVNQILEKLLLFFSSGVLIATLFYSTSNISKHNDLLDNKMLTYVSNQMEIYKSNRSVRSEVLAFSMDRDLMIFEKENIEEEDLLMLALY